MFKFTVAVVLLLAANCLAGKFDEQLFDKTNGFNVAIQDSGKSQEFDENLEEFDETEENEGLDGFEEDEELGENREFSELSKESDEIDEVVDSHVRYLDAAREALLEFARTLRTGQNITNSFLKVIDGFEKQIADFQAALGRRRIDPNLVENLKTFIGEASKNRTVNTIILRTLTAQGLFLAQKSDTRPRAKRDNRLLLEGATAFLESIREDIGEDAFEDYLSLTGLVTLMFVIDDTGSMAGDIRAAIAIATQIVRRDRDYPVDFILSPFNDPHTGPITTKDETQGEEFVTALNALRANGGGDCPELAFRGMRDALESGPQPGSSMYVFTDASPKDATDENVDDVLNLAHDLDVPINFFSRGNCGRPGNVPAYDRVATETGGLVYPLKSSLEIEELGRLVSNTLRGSASIGSGGSGGSVTGRRRRATVSEYAISVDDSIEKILITVTTQNSGAGIILVDPKGMTVTVGKISLARGVVYDIASPTAGVYKLMVPVSAGEHKYRVNAVSGTNIDFGHYYAYVPKRGRNRVPVPLQQPLQGTSTVVFITVAGAESVASESLTLKIVNNDGTVHAEQTLRAVGTSGVRYVARFPLPPLGAFKLELNGRTKKGNQFVRTSPREDKAAPVILRLSYTPDSNVLPRSKTTTLRFQIQRGDVGEPTESYTVSVKDQSGYGEVVRPTARVRRGRIGFARIAFVVPADAPKGRSEKVEVVLTKEGEEVPTTTLTFSLLIV